MVVAKVQVNREQVSVKYGDLSVRNPLCVWFTTMCYTLTNSVCEPSSCSVSLLQSSPIQHTSVFSLFKGKPSHTLVQYIVIFSGFYCLVDTTECSSFQS